jgi:hypothetical protein
MGRTYRRGGDDYNSYGKSLREKRQRGNTKRSNWDAYDYNDSHKSTTKNKKSKDTEYYEDWQQ